MIYRQSLQILTAGVDLSTSMNFVHTQANPSPVFGSIADVIDAQAALSVGGIQATWLAPVSTPLVTPGPGAYSSCWDKAIFTWRSQAGLVVKTVVPAPLESIFLPSGMVDLTNPLVMTYVAACISGLSDSGGSPLAYVTRASRARYQPGIG